MYALDDCSCSSTEVSDSSSDSSLSSEEQDSSISSEEECNSLDECLNQSHEAHSLGDYIRSQSNPSKQQQTTYTDKDLRPFAFVKLNISLGKPELTTIMR